MKIRIDPADAAFSLCIRERTNWHCQHCLRTFPKQSGGLQCSHLFSRRHNSTRYDPENAFAHCFACHQKLGGDPVSFTRWAESVMGPEKVSKLHQKAQLTLKLTKQDKAFIAKHYRAEHRRMTVLRDGGIAGYLPFSHWGTT